MRIVYLGSPSFAVAPLEMLHAAGYEIVCVITQPDRPAGRKRTLTPPAVKEAAERLGLPIWQPERLRGDAAIAQFAALKPDVGIVVAYGEILRPAVLDIPRLGLLNIHPSLLPLHRGATPVVGAILAGDTETGVTLFRLTPGMDDGPILAQATVPLPPDARAGVLNEKLMTMGGQLLLDVLPRYAAGTVVPHPQDHSQATYTRLLSKADGRIDWSLPAVVIERRTRAYDPWPGAYTTWRGQQLKIITAAVHADTPDTLEPGAPGTVHASAGTPLVTTGSGALELVEVQPAGKRAMHGRDWLNGQPAAMGQQLGDAQP